MRDEERREREGVYWLEKVHTARCKFTRNSVHRKKVGFGKHLSELTPSKFNCPKENLSVSISFPHSL